MVTVPDSGGAYVEAVVGSANILNPILLNYNQVFSSDPSKLYAAVVMAALGGILFVGVVAWPLSRMVKVPPLVVVVSAVVPLLPGLLKAVRHNVGHRNEGIALFESVDERASSPSSPKWAVLASARCTSGALGSISPEGRSPILSTSTVSGSWSLARCAGSRPWPCSSRTSGSSGGRTSASASRST